MRILPHRLLLLFCPRATSPHHRHIGLTPAPRIASGVQRAAERLHFFAQAFYASLRVAVAQIQCPPPAECGCCKPKNTVKRSNAYRRTRKHDPMCPKLLEIIKREVFGGPIAGLKLPPGICRRASRSASHFYLPTLLRHNGHAADILASPSVTVMGHGV